MLGWRRRGVVVLAAVLAAAMGMPDVRAQRPDPDPASLVNPFVGTKEPLDATGAPVPNADLGATFPGASAPFGMVQWSPDTSPGSGGGYDYTAGTITGFSARHLSGPGCGFTAYGDFPVMPAAAPPAAGAFDPATLDSTFSHTREAASPGRYSVHLDEPDTDVVLAAGRRFGVGEFTFGSSTGTVTVDAARAASTAGDGRLQVVGDDMIVGEHVGGFFCSFPLTYRMHFAMRFDRPFSSFGTWASAPQGSPVGRSPAVAVPDAPVGSGAWVTFDTAADRQVSVQIAISFVSAENAIENLGTAPGFDADAAGAATRAEWNELLGRVRVEGGTDAERRTFYTALYHALLQPSTFSDANGEYIGYDDQVHVAEGYTHYTDFSGWDTYRSTIQLQSLLAPDVASDVVTSLVHDAEQGGYLPRWGLANYDTGIMAGDPADAVIANAWAFGARRFDAGAALDAMVRGATTTGIGELGQPVSRPGLEDYRTRGYIPRHPTQNEQTVSASESYTDVVRNYLVAGVAGVYAPTSTTMEYAVADFAIAQFAASTGRADIAAEFLPRADSWRNVVNADSGYAQPRERDGSWSPGFAPEHHLGFAEGNSAQYTWMVPHDVPGLIRRLGGADAVVARLDSFFTELNAGSGGTFANMGNQPSFGSPWTYTYAGRPWQTQAVVRRVMTELYDPSPSGMVGNDDLGAMSAEYVWAALGLHPSAPGRSELLLAAPLFHRVRIDLPTGRIIDIRVPGAGTGAPYVHRATLDGRPWNQAWLPASLVHDGGRLEIVASSQPEPAWGASHPPPSWRDQVADSVG